jgi:hypothetical protein
MYADIEMLTLWRVKRLHDDDRSPSRARGYRFRAITVPSTGYHVGMRHDLLNAVLLSSICAFPGCGGDGPVNDLREVESNNVGPTMPPLRAGETIHGAVDVYRDSDYFAVAFPGAGGNLRFKLEVKEKLRRSPDDFWQLMVVVQDQNRTNLGEFDLQKLGPVNVMEQTVGPVTAGAGIGTLEVRAGGFMPEGSRYSVTVNFD